MYVMCMKGVERDSDRQDDVARRPAVLTGPHCADRINGIHHETGALKYAQQGQIDHDRRDQ
jgi:hypothetical protein